MDRDAPALGHGRHRDSPDHAAGHQHPHYGTDQDDEHGHPHHPRRSWRHAVAHRIRPHSHDSADKVDEALETSRAGIRALWMSLLVLLAAAALQAVVVVLSGVGGTARRHHPQRRLRWIGHQLHADAEIELDPSLTLTAAHAIALDAEHCLLHEVPRLRGALIHPDPQPTEHGDPHALTAHHHAPT